ncbi:MAG: hypothetical protein QNK29_05900 [Desulfobacterales bacterium]|nr:hypothetical protein [Desulfobacterales bacterium]MDX2511469.1 hypothetical protein [Desulfobacterales bacterium]
MIHPLKQNVVKMFSATAFAAALVLVLILPNAFSQEVSFKGKTVTMLLNIPPGSSTDVFCRQIMPYVVKYLPGKPKFIVVNKPGGRFMLGASHLYRNVKPDGMTAGALATLAGQMVAGNKMPMDITQFVQVGGIGLSFVFYARKDFGMTSADELLNPPKKIILGSGGPNTSNQLAWRLFMKGNGAEDNYKQIYGYRGHMGLLKAIRSSEINSATMINTLFLQLLPGFTKEGLTTHLYETGVIDPSGNVIPTPGLNIPTITSLWKKFAPQTLNGREFKAYQVLNSSAQLTWQFVLPPKTPEIYGDIWDKAFASALKDKSFVAEMKKAGTLIPFWVDRKEAMHKLTDIKRAMGDPEFKAAIQSVFVTR